MTRFTKSWGNDWGNGYAQLGNDWGKGYPEFDNVRSKDYAELNKFWVWNKLRISACNLLIFL